MLADKNHTILENQNYKKADFSNIATKQLTIINCSFEDCSFDDMKVGEICFGGGKSFSTYTNCSFKNAKFSSIAPGFAKFFGCTFSNVAIKKFLCTSVDIIDCTFSGKIQGSFFNAKPISCNRPDGETKNTIESNDFSNVDFKDVAFRGGVDLSMQSLPSSEQSILLIGAEEILRNAYSKIISWSDLELRRQCLNLIKFLEFELEDGQKDLFFTLSDFPKKQRDSVVELSRLIQ